MLNAGNSVKNDRLAEDITPGKSRILIFSSCCMNDRRINYSMLEVRPLNTNFVGMKANSELI
ncbi:MAG TPA: hypothetical protein VEL11_14845, partial [Candidatus Bathyarchaeia archaeon]|nr:hypothetical protein [Candidatus Bathyarchaeia archaeon]